MKRLAALWLCTCSVLFAQSTLSLEQISKDQQIWPTEVMVVIDHKVPVTENGKTRWKKVGPGKIYTLVSISEKEVTIDGQGTALTFKADETDVIARAEQIKAQKAALAPAQPAPAPVQTPAATPTSPTPASP
jgi:hypothetical protein